MYIVGFIALGLVAFVLFAVMYEMTHEPSYRPMTEDEERAWLRGYNLTEEEVEEIINSGARQ